MKKTPEHIAVADARRNIPRLLNLTQHEGARYVLTRHEKPIALLLPVDDLETLEAIEAREERTP